jgi:hypothetical protein
MQHFTIKLAQDMIPCSIITNKNALITKLWLIVFCDNLNISLKSSAGTTKIPFDFQFGKNRKPKDSNEIP